MFLLGAFDEGTFEVSHVQCKFHEVFNLFQSNFLFLYPLNISLIHFSYVSRGYNMETLK